MASRLFNKLAERIRVLENGGKNIVVYKDILFGR
jgi:hypothetical protein